jgi:hypothetical protein
VQKYAFLDLPQGSFKRFLRVFLNTADFLAVLLRVRKSLQILIAGLSILLGGVVVYWAEQYEQTRRLACVQVITPAEFLKEGVTIGQAGQSACLLSPALRSLTDSAGSLLVSLAPAALSEGPKWIDWLPVDSIRWAHILQYRPGQATFAVNLQMQALAKTVRQDRLKRVVLLIPEEHRQVWLQALGKSLVLEVCPSL